MKYSSFIYDLDTYKALILCNPIKVFSPSWVNGQSFLIKLRYSCDIYQVYKRRVSPNSFRYSVLLHNSLLILQYPPTTVSSSHLPFFSIHNPTEEMSRPLVQGPKRAYTALLSRVEKLEAAREGYIALSFFYTSVAGVSMGILYYTFSE